MFVCSDGTATATVALDKYINHVAKVLFWSEMFRQTWTTKCLGGLGADLVWLAV